MTLRVRLEPLASSSAKLPAIAGAALANGSLHGLPVARSLAEIPRPVERHDPGQRALLAETLERELGRLDPPGRVLTSIHTLGSPGGFCVVTGQQPGLCSGPLYSLYKGLQACRLATELSREWGTPVAPVFWNHADDHDIAAVHDGLRQASTSARIRAVRSGSCSARLTRSSGSLCRSNNSRVFSSGPSISFQRPCRRPNFSPSA